MTKKTIPITAPQLPQPVLAAYKTLRGKDYTAWLAGGCVRDLIMGREPRDWDIVTNAPLAKIRELFTDGLEVGAAFGIIKLPPQGPKTKLVHIDIAMFRRDGEYTDRRHPNTIEPGDEQTDVARRDFTVNALYFDPAENLVIDYVSGHKDIGARILRTVGDPETRFSEDALRILRAVRFAAQLGFKIDRPTAVALKKSASLLSEISRERVHEELWRLLATSKPLMGLEAIAQNGLWEQVFGIKRVSLPADLRQFKASWIPKPIEWICALAVMGLLGDPIKEPAEIAVRVSEQLRLSNNEKRLLDRALRLYQDSESVKHPEQPTDSPLIWIELARNERALIDLLKSFVRRARGPNEEEKTRAVALLDHALRWGAKKDSEKIWPDADALIKEGFKAGPKLGIELRSRQWKAFWTTRPT